MTENAYVIRPIDFLERYTGTSLGTSGPVIWHRNVLDLPFYDSGATYTKDVSVIASEGEGDNTQFVYIGDTGTSHDDPSTPGQTDWVNVGPVNWRRAYDIQTGTEQQSVIETQTENTGSLRYMWSGMGRVTGLAFANFEATQIRATATDISGGTGAATEGYFPGRSYNPSTPDRVLGWDGIVYTYIGTVGTVHEDPVTPGQARPTGLYTLIPA